MSTEQYPPPPEYPPLAPEPPRNHKIRNVVLAAVAAVALAGGGVAAGLAASGGEAPEPKAPASAPQNDAQPAPDVVPAEPQYNTSPTADQFEITLKTMSEQCFGYGVGCNLEVEPDVSYTGSLDLDPAKTYDITYEVTGDEAGVVTETVTVDPLKDGSANLEYFPVLLSTPSADTEPTTEVVRVEEVSYGF